MTVEYVSEYFNVNYINAIELYVYNGNNLELAGRKEFNKRIYRQDELRENHEQMLSEFLKSQALMLKRPVDKALIAQKAKEFIGSSYYEMTDANAQKILNLATKALPESRYLDC